MFVIFVVFVCLPIDNLFLLFIRVKNGNKNVFPFTQTILCLEIFVHLKCLKYAKDTSISSVTTFITYCLCKLIHKLLLKTDKKLSGVFRCENTFIVAKVFTTFLMANSSNSLILFNRTTFLINSCKFNPP